jgi:hypothetical protein
MDLVKFKREYQKAKETLLEYEQFLGTIQKPNTYVSSGLNDSFYSTPIHANLKHILKANLWLMLYNTLEGTVRNGIMVMKTAVNTAGLKYQNLNDALRKLWIKLNEEKIYDPKKAGKKIDNLKTYFETIAFNEPVFFSANEDDAFEGNGNLAFDELETVLKTYGVRYLDPSILNNPHSKTYYDYVCATQFSITTQIAPNSEPLVQFTVKTDLEEIRKRRISLAHGKRNFVEIGQQNDAKLLVNARFSILAALDFFVNNVAHYVENEHFKVQ